MAKVHVDEYRKNAENCRVQAERASGDRKAKWIDLAERWDEAADRVEVSAAAVDVKRDKDLFALEVDRHQEPPMQDIIHPNLDASSPPDRTAPPMRKRRSGMIACGVSALALGLVGGVSLHRTVDRDPSEAGLQQTGSGLQSSFAGARKQVARWLERFTSRPVSVEQTRDAVAWKPSHEAVVERAVSDLSLRVDQVRAASEGEAREVVLGLASIRSAAEQYDRDLLGKLTQLEGRLERIERQSNAGVASPTAKPVVPDASGNTKPAAQLLTPSLTQLISKPGRQPAPSTKNKASAKQTSKDLHAGTDTKAIANWTLQGRPAPGPVVVAPPAVVTSPAPVETEPVVVIRPGSIIPTDVVLEPFVGPPTPALRRYSYFISPSNKIVVVEPVGRRVVRVLGR
jgi:hypothetical protein